MQTVKPLNALLLLYAAASLLHFIHNAEFLSAYPGLPSSWTRWTVYFAWGAMSAVGLVGWLFLQRGYEWLGLFLLVVYAALGMDSLGHYVVAAFSQHTLMMNATILVEVTAAALAMIEVARLAVRKLVATSRSRAR
jgi:hypothetical protein